MSNSKKGQKRTQFSYEHVGNGWLRSVSLSEICTPLTEAVEEVAGANPGKVVLGVSKETSNEVATVEEVLHVDVLEGL